MTTTFSEPTVISSLVARPELPNRSRHQMFHLLADHFNGISRAQFEQDLKEKNWVILLERAGALTGFSTLVVYESNFEGQPVTIVYSGDTIVARDAWGSTALARTWIASV